MIGFIGLTHLGLNYSLATAAKGFDVIAYDPDESLVGNLRKGEFPIEEPGFLELYSIHGRKLSFTSDAADLAKCSVVFYSLDVRTNARNESDPSALSALIESTSPTLSKGTTAVVMSQVRPGYMRAMVGTSGSSDVSWYYQVETLIFGDAVRRAMEPERYIIGAAKPAESLPLEYKAWLGAFGCPLLVMGFESAELAKIAINFFLVSSVSTTNTLAEVCEAIGADWGEIVPALRLDRRIGPFAYLKPGLGIAGGNLERDLVTVQGIAKEQGTEAGIVSAWQENSRHAKKWVLRALERQGIGSSASARLAVWGLAYKQDTHSIKNSASIELTQALPHCTIRAYDPAASVPAGAFPNLTVCRTAGETLDGADALLIMTPWGEFAGALAREIAQRISGKLVLDPYGVLKHHECAAAGLIHRQIGIQW